jgi:hypothetical protein
VGRGKVFQCPLMRAGRGEAVGALRPVRACPRAAGAFSCTPCLGPAPWKHTAWKHASEPTLRLQAPWSPSSDPAPALSSYVGGAAGAELLARQPASTPAAPPSGAGVATPESPSAVSPVILLRQFSVQSMFIICRRTSRSTPSSLGWTSTPTRTCSGSPRRRWRHHCRRAGRSTRTKMDSSTSTTPGRSSQPTSTRWTSFIAKFTPRSAG